MIITEEQPVAAEIAPLVELVVRGAEEQELTLRLQQLSNDMRDYYIKIHEKEANLLWRTGVSDAIKVLQGAGQIKADLPPTANALSISSTQRVDVTPSVPEKAVIEEKSTQTAASPNPDSSKETVELLTSCSPTVQGSPPGFSAARASCAETGEFLSSGRRSAPEYTYSMVDNSWTEHGETPALVSPATLLLDVEPRRSKSEPNISDRPTGTKRSSPDQRVPRNDPPVLKSERVEANRTGRTKECQETSKTSETSSDSSSSASKSTPSFGLPNLKLVLNGDAEAETFTSPETRVVKRTIAATAKFESAASTKPRWRWSQIIPLLVCGKEQGASFDDQDTGPVRIQNPQLPERKRLVESRAKGQNAVSFARSQRFNGAKKETAVAKKSTIYSAAAPESAEDEGSAERDHRTSARSFESYRKQYLSAADASERRWRNPLTPTKRNNNNDTASHNREFDLTVPASALRGRVSSDSVSSDGIPSDGRSSPQSANKQVARKWLEWDRQRQRC